MFYSYRGRTRWTAAFDEQQARDCPFHVTLPPPDVNDREHRKDHLNSGTDRPREGAVGGKLIHKRSTEHGWRFHPRGLRRVDATNEHQPDTRRGRHLHAISAFRISFSRTISD